MSWQHHTSATSAKIFIGPSTATPLPTSQNGSRSTQRWPSHLRRTIFFLTRATRNMGLVTGASGRLGVAAIEKFLAADWEGLGAPRRKPELPSGRDVQFLSV